MNIVYTNERFYLSCNSTCACLVCYKLPRCDVTHYLVSTAKVGGSCSSQNHMCRPAYPVKTVALKWHHMSMNTSIYEVLRKSYKLWSIIFHWVAVHTKSGRAWAFWAGFAIQNSPLENASSGILSWGEFCIATYAIQNSPMIELHYSLLILFSPNLKNSYSTELPPLENQIFDVIVVVNLTHEVG